MDKSVKTVAIVLAIVCSSVSNSSAQSVSFEKDVSPIIVAKCGKCHVSDSRGQYGIASYNALMDSGSITPNDPADSQFLEVIESGEMPKGGLQVSATEFATLKKWIAEGAKFDGDDEKKMLAGASQNGSGRGGSRGGKLQAVEQNPQAVGEQGVAWYVTWDKALTEAKRSNRPIFFMSAATQCSGVSGVF